MPLKDKGSRYASVCYGQPLGISVKINSRGARGVVKEGKQKKYCRTCVRLIMADIRQQLILKLKEVGLR